MHTSVETESGKTHLRHSASSACFWSGPVSAEGIMASGLCVPHQQAAHMAAPTEEQSIKKALANGEPSTHGANQAFSIMRLRHSRRSASLAIPNTALAPLRSIS